MKECKVGNDLDQYTIFGCFSGSDPVYFYKFMLGPSFRSTNAQTHMQSMDIDKDSCQK